MMNGALEALFAAQRGSKMQIDLRHHDARIASLLSLLLFCLIPAPAFASELPPPTLNPKRYVSPSGKYVLFVNPSDLYGRGKATYGLTLEGREAWSAEHPYTLWDARVADDGVVAGYGYSHGWRGFSEGGIKDGWGDFRVVIIDSTGKDRLNEATARENTGAMHSPPAPLASNLIMDAANDRLAIMIGDLPNDRPAEPWWIFQLSTGKKLQEPRPKNFLADQNPPRFLIAAKPVDGTPLTLLHWWRHDPEPDGKRGARFALMTHDGKPVWSLDLPDDYESDGDEKSNARLLASVRRISGILESDQSGRFDLWFVKEGQRVTFKVARTSSGRWAAAEVAHRPFVETKGPPLKFAAIPRLELRQTGRFVLASPRSAPATDVRDVRDFVFDPQGRIAFLRRSENRSLELAVVDQQGKLIRAVPLEAASPQFAAGWSELTCVGPNRFLLVRDNPDDRNKHTAVVVDIATGKTAPIPGFTTTSLSKVAGFPDGGVALIGTMIHFQGGAISDGTLRSFDGQGKLLGSVPGNGDSNDPTALFSPKDITFTTDGKIAVVDVIRKIVQFFDRAGKHHHTFDLEKHWGREPNYPSNISADNDRGIVVRDFGGDPPIVRMRVDGSIRAQVLPRLKDGRAINLSDAQVAPDGVLWVSDGHALYRLLDSGLTGRVLGEAPSERTLDKAAAVTVDKKGLIYAADGRTGAVHVFAPDGRWLRVCVPEPGDVKSQLYAPNLTVSDSGDTYLGLGRMGGDRFLHFALTVNASDSTNPSSMKSMRSGSRSPAHPAVGCSGDQTVFLVDEKGAVVRTITRRADGFWLGHPQAASTAPDGSIAIVSTTDEWRRDERELVVSIYSPGGDPILSFKLPQTVVWSNPEIAFDGNRVVLIGARSIVLASATGKPFGQFVPAHSEQVAWTPFLAPTARACYFSTAKKPSADLSCREAI